MITHKEASRIALAMWEAKIEGADIIAQYVDEQSTNGELTDRELTLRSWRRSDEACARLAELERWIKSA